MSTNLKNGESAALNPWTTHGLHINLPMGVLAFVLGRKLFRESQDASARTLSDFFGVGLGLWLSDIGDQYRHSDNTSSIAQARELCRKRRRLTDARHADVTGSAEILFLNDPANNLTHSTVG